MTRAFLVVNPAAGAGRTRRLWRTLRERLRGVGLAFESTETDGRGAATEIARRAAGEGWPLVVAVGGDGTVNEVVNGLVDASGRARASLGVIVTGRGRDVCRNLGIAADPEVASRRLVDGEEILADLGRVEWDGGHARYFLNAVGAGFDAVVARRAEARPGAGTVPYLLAVLGAIRAHRSLPAEIAVDDQRVWSGPLTAAVVANGSHYGGGMKIAPAADPADGWLDLIVLGDLGRAELLRWLPSVFSGRHLENPKVTAHRGRTVRIDATTRLPMHLDGEAAPETPARISVLPRALRLRR
ncbi:MAG: diacylglycerol kinase family lipid kinase [Candidatus Rokubacteria bacterium]|nr:diacylglycerol kinase family lipid kinase [Candidatus Rokubacteria bacterium]